MCVPFPFQNKENWNCFIPSTNVRHFVYTLMRSAQSFKHYIYASCCPGQMGWWNLIVARGMLKPVYFAFVETMLNFFFCKLHILHPGSRGLSSKYLRWNKPVDIESSFSSALRAPLTRLHREPSVSITQFVKSRAHSPRPTSKIISMILLRDAPFWWRQNLWWAFMQIACSAVVHTHVKKTLFPAQGFNFPFKFIYGKPVTRSRSWELYEKRG